MKAQKKSTHQKEPRFEDFEKEYVIEFSIESDSTSSEKVSPKVQKKIKIEKQPIKEKNQTKKIELLEEPTKIVKTPQPTKQKSELKEKSASESEEEETYQVEKIIDQKKQGKKTLYLVKWDGYPEEEATWEPEQNLINDGCQKHIDEFFNPKKQQDQPDLTKQMKLTEKKQEEPTPQKQPTPQKKLSSQEEPTSEKEESLSMEQVESSEKQSSLEKQATSGPTIEKVLNIRKSEGGMEFKIQYSDDTECWMDSKIPKSICPQKVFEFYESKMKFINK